MEGPVSEDVVHFKSLPPPNEFFAEDRRSRLLMSFVARRKKITIGSLHEVTNIAMRLLAESSEERVNEFCLGMIRLGGFEPLENEWIELNSATH